MKWWLQRQKHLHRQWVLVIQLVPHALIREVVHQIPSLDVIDEHGCGGVPATHPKGRHRVSCGDPTLQGWFWTFGGHLYPRYHRSFHIEEVVMGWINPLLPLLSRSGWAVENTPPRGRLRHDHLISTGVVAGNPIHATYLRGKGSGHEGEGVVCDPPRRWGSRANQPHAKEDYRGGEVPCDPL